MNYESDINRQIQRPETFNELDEHTSPRLTKEQAASVVDAVFEPLATEARCAVSPGSLPGLRAEVMVDTWRRLANSCYARADECERLNLPELMKAQLAAAKAFTTCAEMLSREMEAASVRQPEENIKITHAEHE